MQNPVHDKIILDTVFLKYTGHEDEDNGRLTAEVAETYVKEGYRKIVLDMGSVAGLLSSTINRIVAMIKRVTLAGGELFIVNVPDPVLRVLRSVKLDMRLKIYLTEKDFLQDHDLEEKTKKNRVPREGDSSKEMRLEKTLVGNAHFIMIQGSLLEDYQAKELYDMSKIALENGARKLVFDLKHMPYIDSTSISVFIRIRKLCQQHKATIEVVGAGEQVSDVFNLSGLANLLGLDAED
jgi:anti-anti-sigma factor